MKVDFEVGEGVMPVSGIALFQCFGDDGHPYTAHAFYGEPKPQEVILLLTILLDQLRYTYVDKEATLEDLGFEVVEGEE